MALRTLLLPAPTLFRACSGVEASFAATGLDGGWTPDVATLVNETFPKAIEEYKAQVTAKVRERMSGIAIDAKAWTVISRKADGDVRITITGYEPLQGGGMKMTTRDDRTGAAGKLIWKYLSADKIETHKPDGPRVVFFRKKEMDRAACSARAFCL